MVVEVLALDRDFFFAGLEGAGEEEEEEEEENAIATASEYVFVTRGGRIASITDLSIGIGLQLFESE